MSNAAANAAAAPLRASAHGDHAVRGDGSAVRASPLAIYNHGLISFTAENTSLMEELASHGYTVLA
jgi:hypothetical protein